eukprot:comp24038_c2_seq1/m.43045 comp24038_c2_seq1/g.43045  ORF comp24038_c2_seq1/g.43045 comp24038_c2_seq1/m.43045 type:complete len:618 (-) comp24038_c2_seq1:63-1916(-)
MHLKRPGSGLPWACNITTRIAIVVGVAMATIYCANNMTQINVQPSQLINSFHRETKVYVSSGQAGEENDSGLALPPITEPISVQVNAESKVQPNNQAEAQITGENAGVVTPQPVTVSSADTRAQSSLVPTTKSETSVASTPSPTHSSTDVQPRLSTNETETKENESNSTEVEGGRCGDAKVENGTVEEGVYSVEGYPFDVQRHFPKLNTLTRKMGDVGVSVFRCEGNHTCVWTNLCVDHTKNDTLFIVNDIHFPTFHYKSKGVWYNVSVTTRPETNESERVMYINGTTHMMNVDFSNWFFTILKTFSLRRTIDLFTGRDENFNLMLYQKSSFVRDLAMPYFQMYRTIHPAFKHVYYLKSSVNRHKANITCFERVVFGYEYMGQPLTGFTGKHLDEALVEVQEAIRIEPDPILKIRNKRLLEVHEILGPELRAYRKYSLTQMGKYHVQMEPKLAVLVARNEGRSCFQEPYRVILNQDDLIRVLEEEGYTVKVVDFAGMSAPEQIEISRQANLFIAVHGAGVANIFWMHQTACVLELHTYGFQKWGYETFANYLDLPYVSWVNQKEEHTNVTWHSQKYPEGHANFYRSRNQWVDPEEFRLAVKAAGKKSEKAIARNAQE